MKDVNNAQYQKERNRLGSQNERDSKTDFSREGVGREYKPRENKSHAVEASHAPTTNL